MSNIDYSEITYPYATPPQKGEWIAVAEGVYWLQMVLPMALNHINLYAIEDRDGWWVVDTGMKIGDTRERWELLFDGPMAGKPIVGVICTHMHPDHTGQAGWLCSKWRAPLYMSQAEYLSGRVFGSAPNTESEWSTAQYYHRSGVPDEALKALAEKFRGFGDIVEPLPRSYRRLRDGQVLRIGERDWQVMVGSGHSPEHVCLFDPGDHILLSGDQIIPRITSNVSVMSGEPEANPLEDWFTSLRRFRRDLPSDCLVLPAHNAPFYGVHARLDYLIAHHESHLAAIERACVVPKSAIELFDVLFTREIDDTALTLALGESVAHLHYLYYLGRLEREIDATGTYRYRSLDPDHCPYVELGDKDDQPFEV